MMEIIIKPKKFAFLNLKEIYEHRDILFFLTWKDIKIKYKQTLLGFSWIILQPLLITFVFVLFSKAINFSLGDSKVPYTIYVLSGILLWNLFSSAIIQTSNSIVSNAHIIKKIYFPRIFFPISALFVSTFDFLISFIIYIPLMSYYKIYPSFSVIYIFPLVYLLLAMLILGIGSFFAALNVKYRDVKYTLPFLIQLFFFISPVFYAHNLIELNWLKNLYYANPLTGIIELFRHSLFNTPLYFHGLKISIIFSIIIFFTGIFYFRKMENILADIT
ncbi:MAG: ABC transporter permease [Bacteroidales bacterium]|nr:ABC transporter permease [Bacteroidales bacterium]